MSPLAVCKDCPCEFDCIDDGCRRAKGLPVPRPPVVPRGESELEKFSGAHSTMETIRDFLEWLDGQKIELGKPNLSGRWLERHFEDREPMLMRYLELDPVKLENERREL